MRRRVRIVGLAIALAATGARASPETATPNGKSWRDGPVSYLLTEDEYRRYGRLKTDEAREAYVRRFWNRLDPDASTQENEFRVRFEERCREADARFGTFPGTGWRTDRGRVLILLGEPDAIEKQSGDPNSIEREIWVYGLDRAERGPLRIVFYRGLDGRYRLNPVRRFGPPRGLGAVPSREQQSAMAQLRLSLPALPRNLRSTLLDTLLGGVHRSSIPSVPPPRRDRTTEPASPSFGASASPPPRATPPKSRVTEGAWFFQAADGSVLALLAADVDPPDAEGAETEALVGVGYILDDERAEGRGARSGTIVPLEPGRLVGAGPKRRFVGRAYLEPGVDRRIRYAFTDEGRSTLLVRTRRITAPELGTGGLEVSSLVPADDFGPLPAGGSSPFAVGSEIVVPRPDAVFLRNEPLRLYFQVYGARVDEADGRPRLDVTFRFERTGGRRARRHGKPLVIRGAVGASIGLVLPIGDWPLGSYRARVEIRDRLGGERAETELAFRIAD